MKRRKGKQRTKAEIDAIDDAYIRIHDKIQLLDIRKQVVHVRRNGSDVLQKLTDGRAR